MPENGSHAKDDATPVMRLEEDTTLRWPCRKGDFVLWFSQKGFMAVAANPKDVWTIRDVWEMRDGDAITITNRIVDVPSWFELHPTEACNAAALAMMQKLDDGYEPGEIVNGPNIWRLMAGDKVAWVGPPRAGQQGSDGILCVLDCWECALAVGEPGQQRLEGLIAFGSLTEAAKSKEAVTLCRKAVKLVQGMDGPFVFAERWYLAW